jgi:hypothetical protein
MGALASPTISMEMGYIAARAAMPPEQLQNQL